MNALRKATVGALLIPVFVAMAAAQDPAKDTTKKGNAPTCPVDEGNPVEIRSAATYLSKGLVSPHPDEQPRNMKDAVRVLNSNGGKFDNQPARHWMLGQALYWWATRPGAKTVVQRGSVGYTENPNGTIDLLAAMDTAFTALATEKPECASAINVYRQNASAPMINALGPLINAKMYDSASVVLANVAPMMGNSPWLPYYRAVIATGKNDDATAAREFKATADAVTGSFAADSNLSKVKRGALFNYAVLSEKAAMKMTGEEKKNALKAAAADFKTYIDQFPSGESINEARTGYATALAASGDTTSVANMSKDMLSDPTKFQPVQLLDAGVASYQAGRYAESSQLLEAALTQNPNYRNALFNLANTYLKVQQYDKMLPVALKLTSIDPNYPDNWKLLAAAYQGLGKAAGDAKAKKGFATDSVLKYLEKSNKAKVKVTFKGLTSETGTRTLAGTVENLATTPGNYSIKIELLDKTGAVVGTQNADVSVPPKGKADFSVTVDNPSVVAYRYAPIA